MANRSPHTDRLAHLSPAKRALLEKRLRGENTAASSQAAAGTITPQPENAPPALSYAQERLWFLHQLSPNSAAYNMHEAIEWQGSLNKTALEQAVHETVARHASLRTSFHSQNGQPFPVVVPQLTLPLPVIDLQTLTPQEQESKVQELAQAEAQRPFDLSTGPLLRTSLLQCAPERFIFLLTMHHIVGDEWSLDQLWRELRERYRAQRLGQTPHLPDLPITYSDYAHWQRNQLANGRFSDSLAYWKNQLAGELPRLQLPTDRPRPSADSDRGGMRSHVLPGHLLPALRQLSQDHKTTRFMTLMAAFQALLHRYSQQTDILIGTPVINRSQPETQQLLGLFLNTLVIRQQIKPDQPFSQLLAQTRQTMLDGFAHQELPYEQVVQTIRPQRSQTANPLFQVMFVYQQAQPVLEDWPDARLTRLPVDGGVSKFDLTLFITETADSLTAAFEYRQDLFTAETVDRMLTHFEVLLTGIVASPETAVAQLPLLPAGEKAAIASWQQSTTVQFDQLPDRIHTLIETIAQQTPQATAVTADRQSLTYAELNQKANQLAHYLRTKGAGPGQHIALCLPRSAEMIIGILGILKAGGTYVPLDPSYPAERLSWMLKDAEATFLLTHGPIARRFAEQVNLIDLAADWAAIAQQPAHPPNVSLPADALAYIIYTSGSTGRPKGVMVSHGNLVHSTLARHHYYPRQVKRFLLLSSIAFDSSVAGIFGTLCQGGELLLPEPEEEHNIQQLAQRIAAHRVTHMLALPSLYALLLAGAAPAQLDSLTDVIVAGESCDSQLVQAHMGRLPQTALYNEYGPTEATVWATVYHIEPEWRGANVPIGKPIPNGSVFLLDSQQQAVPVGVPGELYIAGPGVVPGYWQRPELTAQRFVDLRHDGQFILAYRSGDLARWLPDGNLQFLGRVDQQVKLRGYRIELGELESLLKQHDAVAETAVTVQKSGKGVDQLIAYVVWQPQFAPDPQQLRSYLQKRVPGFMVPNHFVTLRSLPRTPNGKLNRAALPAPEAPSVALSTTDLPQNATEATIAKIWGEVLQHPEVGRTDNFFELGGHSLLATQVMSRVQQTFNLVLPLQNLFNAPTVAALAESVLEAQRTETASPAPTIRRASRDAYRRQR